LIFLLIFIFSLHFIQKFAFEFFLKLHFFLSFIAIIILFWHLFIINTKFIILPSLAMILWVLNLILQLYNTQRQKGKISEIFTIRKKKIMKLQIDLKKPISVKPGDYFYLRFWNTTSVRDKFQSHPFMILWWEENRNPISSKNDITNTTTSIIFLIQEENGISSRLKKQLLMQPIENIILEGPYNQNLMIENYENIILIAQGIGIAGVLSYALYLANLKSQKNSLKKNIITRKLNLYWLLDNNCDEKLVEKQFQKLLEIDKEKV